MFLELNISLLREAFGYGLYDNNNLNLNDLIDDVVNGKGRIKEKALDRLCNIFKINENELLNIKITPERAEELAKDKNVDAVPLLPKQIIAKNIRMLRKAYGYSQKNLGDKIKASNSVISHIESGLRVDEHYIKSLADFFNIPFADLSSTVFDWGYVQLLSMGGNYESLKSKILTGSSITERQNDVTVEHYDNEYNEAVPSFRNEPSKRFFEWYQSRFDSKQLKRKQVGADLQLGNVSYTYEFWKLLYKGEISVNIDQVLLAHKHHGLNPLWLFGYSNQQEVKPGQADILFGAPVIEEQVSEWHMEKEYVSSSFVGAVIDKILDEHQTPRTEYPTKVLGMTPRTLQRIMKGDIRPSFVTVLQIAEDHGVSLDVFRTKPLPKGHLLAVIKEKDRIIESKDQQINNLLDYIKTLKQIKGILQS